MKYQLIMPSSIDHLRNAIIDKLMAISNKDYLVALNKLMESEVAQSKIDKEELPEHVVEGIKRGQADYEAGRYVTLEAFEKKLLSK
ncbi:hypothetical protein [Pedobacter frigoris]|uniref:hypothetical protein n=1 Tax=Pedobacter frigoris TaxID=2571272 RepID=UPI00292D3002|nr:hypothetical protein [Pedobacter frigoris]